MVAFRRAQMGSAGNTEDSLDHPLDIMDLTEPDGDEVDQQMG
jgi:hypothetical protein